MGTRLLGACVGPVLGQRWVVSALGHSMWEAQTPRLNCGMMCSVLDTEVGADIGGGRKSNSRAASRASAGRGPGQCVHAARPPSRLGLASQRP